MIDSVRPATSRELTKDDGDCPRIAIFACAGRINANATNYFVRNKLTGFVIPSKREVAHHRQHRKTKERTLLMSAPNGVNRVAAGPFRVSTLKWISIRLVLPIVLCGTVAVGLQTTIAGGPKLAAADLPQLASLTPEATSEAAPAAAPGQSAVSSHGPGDARHQAAAAMLLLLVATAKSRRDGGEAQRQAAAAERSVNRQTADAGQLR